MRKHLIRAMVVATGLALIVVTSALAKPETVRVGNLFLRDNGGISPTKLPRHKQAPISALFNAQIGTVDGSHPPAIESVIADFDKNIQVNAKGLPVCGQAQLVARSTAAAKKACPDAIVGSGRGEVEVAFPEQDPIVAKGPIYLFNGGVHGATTLLFIHTYVNVPAPTAVVVTTKITHIHRGHYGLHTVSKIPAIAGGAGSVTKFKLTIDRTFTDSTVLKVTHLLPCTPMD